MTVDANRLKFLSIIEGQGRIDNRFSNPRRLDSNGGGGTFSLLFEAEDEQRANSKVALKFLYPFERDPYRRECFDRESEVLTKLTGQKDIIQLIAAKSEYIYSVGPLDIPFSYYAVENGGNGSWLTY